MRLSVCRGRSVVKRIVIARFSLIDTFFKDPVFFPKLFRLFFSFDEIGIWRYFFVHLFYPPYYFRKIKNPRPCKQDEDKKTSINHPFGIRTYARSLTGAKRRALLENYLLHARLGSDFRFAKSRRTFTISDSLCAFSLTTLFVTAFGIFIL